jgi:predicted ATPase
MRERAIITLVIRRFYVHNFRCLENFELPVSGKPSVLLIGKNGSGKTTVGFALEILQKIGRGTNRIGDLVKPGDFARGRSDVPMRFELEFELEAKHYSYTLALELPRGSKELRVLEEKLDVGSKSVYAREGARVNLLRMDEPEGLQRDAGLSSFDIDRNLAALPIIQSHSVLNFKQWLARMLILRPIPAIISGDSEEETLQPNIRVTDFGAWFSGLLAYAPSAYTKIDDYLKQVMSDLKDIKNPPVGKDSRSLEVQFSNDQGRLTIPFADLSDGEKCFMICALVLAANDAYGPVVCFWDEPDNYLAISEVGHFVMALRRAFQSGGQFIATTHNSEAIRCFSDENTLVLFRRNHVEPTMVRPLSELHLNGDLVGALIRDDVEP